MIATVETSINNSLLATRKVINPTTTKANTAIATEAAMTTNTAHQRHHASKSMSTLIRLREQRKTAQNDVCDGVQPSNTKDEDNQNMAVQKDDDKIAVDDGDVQKEATITKVSSSLLSSPIDVRRFLDVSTNVSSENDNQLDLYAPLMPEEADEDQLAGFFIGLDDGMYAPLMPEEADEDQLAGFFTGLDVTFLQPEEEHEGCGIAASVLVEEEEEKDVFTASSTLAATKTSLDVFYPASKRRKVSIEEEEQYYSSSSSASHCSYYSNDIDDGDDSSNDHQDDDNILRRKLGSRGIDFFHRNE